MSNVTSIKVTLGARVTKDWITEVDINQVFVFGSNLDGRHGAGAALLAKEVFGAEQGKGEGQYGHSYALPTCNENIKPLPLEEIRKHIRTFCVFAREHMENQYLVTEIGCGLAGYTPKDIAPLFPDMIMSTGNVSLPASFWEVLFNSKYHR